MLNTLFSRALKWADRRRRKALKTRASNLVAQNTEERYPQYPLFTDVKVREYLGKNGTCSLRILCKAFNVPSDYAAPKLRQWVLDGFLYRKGKDYSLNPY